MIVPQLKLQGPHTLLYGYRWVRSSNIVCKELDELEDKNLCTYKKQTLNKVKLAESKQTVLKNQHDHPFCIDIKRLIWLETSDYKGLQTLTNIRGTKYRCIYCYHDSRNNKKDGRLKSPFRTLELNEQDVKTFLKNPKNLIASFGIGGKPLTPWYPSRKVPPGYHIRTGLATRCLHIERAFVRNLAVSKGQNLKIVDTLEVYNQDKISLIEDISKRKAQISLLRNDLLLSDDKNLVNTYEKEIQRELTKLRESRKKLRNNEKTLEKLTKLTFESSIYGKWMLEVIGSGIAMSKYHTEALEGKAAHLYKENMGHLHSVWRDYSSPEENQNWEAIVRSFQIIWREMTLDGTFKADAETREVFYGFRQLLHNFTGGNYPSSHGAFKVHLLEHCYDFMAFYNCSLRCLDETNQESFHKRANKLHDRAKYNKNRMLQEKRFLQLLDAQGHPAFYERNV